MKQALSVEQAAALLAFAARSGRSWKAELRTVWATCGYDRAGVGHEEAACLQQVRNAFGPSWLDRVTMKQLKNITRWAQRAATSARYDREAEARAATARGITLPAGVTIRGDASTEPGAGGFEIAPPLAARHTQDEDCVDPGDLHELEEAQRTAAAFINDIPLDVATRAHAFSSHTPEERGAQERAGYAAMLEADYEVLKKLIVGEYEKHELFAAEFERYRQGYRARYIAKLEADSRCASTMVTGGSNFNTRRNDKANRVSDKRREELIEFRRRALDAIRKVLRPEDAPILASDSDAAERLEEKIATAEKSQEMMKAANVAIRKNATAGVAAQVAALLALGFTEKTAHEALKPDFCGRVGFPTYALTNNGANIRRMRERLVAVTQAKATPDATVEGTAARLEDAPGENRVRLFFPGKPDVSVRTTLKSRGFRWTPSLGCWQAYRNPSSLAVAQQIAGIEVPS